MTKEEYFFYYKYYERVTDLISYPNNSYPLPPLDLQRYQA